MLKWILIKDNFINLFDISGLRKPTFITEVSIIPLATTTRKSFLSFLLQANPLPTPSSPSPHPTLLLPSSPFAQPIPSLSLSISLLPNPPGQPPPYPNFFSHILFHTVPGLEDIELVINSFPERRYRANIGYPPHILVHILVDFEVLLLKYKCNFLNLEGVVYNC